MNDPISGQMIFKPDELKKASEEYLANLLKNRAPKEGYQQNLDILKELHATRMAEDDPDAEELTGKDYQDMLKKMKKKKADKYKFTLNGGDSYQNALFCLYKKVWSTEEKPLVWEKTSCTMLYKQKGSRNEFSNQRFIHSKDEIPKGFESLVMEKAKPKIRKKMFRVSNRWFARTPVC